jgi:hypothetical protein
MAALIAYQSGDWTGATTWKQIATGTGSSQTTFTTSTQTTTSYVYCPAFTVTNGQVIEGVMLHLRRFTNTTGTFSVALSDDNGTTATREVTVNVADLPQTINTTTGSWVFFKFASTLTADGGNDYRVGVRSSTANTVWVLRSSTTADWARIFRRSDTATIAGTDNVYICDELTGEGTKDDIEVTMNQTSSATTYGAIDIGFGGVLSYGTSASTNYHLKLAGNITVRSGGTFNIGTTGTPIPRTSTAKLEFACTSAVQYGLEVLAGGTFNAQGLSRTSGNNSYYCLLNTDEAVNSTSLGVDTDTGWLDNDRIVLSATGSVLAQWEVGTLNGNASSDTLTVDGFAGSGGGLAFAHSGTAPTQAEVALLTRNVEIFGASRTNTTYLLFQTTATVDMDWVYVKWIGSATSTKYGIEIQTTTGSCNVQYCAIEETSTTAGSAAFFIQGNSANNITISNNVIYDAGHEGVRLNLPTSGTSLEVNNNIIIRTANFSIVAGDVGGTINGNRISGSSGLAGINFAENNAVIGSADANVVHNCNSSGITTVSVGIISNGSVWHNNLSNNTIRSGIAVTSQSNEFVTFSGVNVFGNRQTNIYTGNLPSLAIFENCTMAGSTTLATPAGVSYTAINTLIFRSCTFRGATGIYTAHTTGDIVALPNATGDIFLENCVLNATTEVANQSNLGSPFAIGSQKHDQTAGSHRAWKKFGTITTDSTIFKTASPSERLTPNDASGKLESGTKLVAIENATTKTISVWVRESVVGDGTDYNGNRPRLRYRRSDAAGVTTDGTLDTATASAEGDWEQLTGTSPAITDDAVLEFYVDCDGTAGWVNVDDWTVS